jgi:hypothetical protein
MGATEGTRGLIRDFRVFFFSNDPQPLDLIHF